MLPRLVQRVNGSQNAPGKRYDLWSSVPMDGRNVTEPEIWSRVVDTSHACGWHFAQGESVVFEGWLVEMMSWELVSFNTPTWTTPLATFSNGL